MRLALASLAVVLCACSGPAAPDGALCRDLINRVCAAPRCGVVETQLNPGDQCVSVLTAAAGCPSPANPADGDPFAFTSPSRDRVLECRIPLLRQGDETTVHPACTDVDEFFATCPDVVKFLGGP